ncbi:MAG: hypothetical protein NVSMB39_5400 [Candidatus Saccharimonadales bacterium]
MNEVCQEIITIIAGAVDAESAQDRQVISTPGGTEVGQQIVLDAAEATGLMNLCRLSILNVDIAPAGEAARIEFEHEKQTPEGKKRVYSVQSVRRVDGKLVLLENFMAHSAKNVREADFSEISSETYARDTIMKSLQEWVKFRAWQLQESGKKGK